MDAKRQRIEQMKQLAKLKNETKKIVPEVYACFCKVLYDSGWTPDDIETLFIATQTLWQDNLDSMDNMIDWCANTTGIEVRTL